MATISEVLDVEVLTTECKLRPELGSANSKTVTLKIHVGNLDKQSAVDCMISKYKIAWQNTKRKDFDKLEDGGVYEYRPGTKTSYVRVMTPEESLAYAEEHPEWAAKMLAAIEAKKVTNNDNE